MSWQGGAVDLRLDLRVPGAGAVRTVWTPAAMEPKGWAWLQHGFARSSGRLGGLAGALASQGITVVRPDISSFTPWRSLHDRDYLGAVARRVAESVADGTVAMHGVAAGGPWLGIGHSAGAAVVVEAAAVLADQPVDLGGLILLDPVDTVGGLMAAALPGVGEVPMVAFACAPSRCNRHGATLATLTGRVEVVDLPGLSHADPERIPADLRVSSVPPAGRAVTALCGAGGTPDAVVDLGERVLAVATRLTTL